MLKTYPCVVGHRIVELTAEQRATHEWRSLSAEEKIARLLVRIEALERAQSPTQPADPTAPGA